MVTMPMQITTTSESWRRHITTPYSLTGFLEEMPVIHSPTTITLNSAPVIGIMMSIQVLTVHSTIQVHGGTDLAISPT